MRLDKQSSADEFVDHLADLHFGGVFNPYVDVCPHCDMDDAAKIRRQNLVRVLDSALAQGVSSIWVARDLGYRGGRRTGLALTDEVNLSSHAELFGVRTLRRATIGPMVSERTAKVVWRTLRMIDQPIFLWNVFPLHPHGPASPMTNRRHTRAERLACSHLLEWLIAKLRPRIAVGLGRDAYEALIGMNVIVQRIRHPSYGGQREFESGIERLYPLQKHETNRIPRLRF